MNTGIRNMVVVGIVAALLFLASCKKNGNNDGIGFTAMTEQNEHNSKTHLDGYNVLWTAYDQIKVATKEAPTTSYTFELTSGENKSNGTFYTGEPHPSPDFFDESGHDYIAVYPATSTINSASEVAFALPSTQTRSATQYFDEGLNPMVAVSSNRTLQFKNVCGVLGFQLTGCEHLASLRLTAKDATNLWGTYTVTYNGSGTPTGSVTGGSNALTLICNVDLSTTPKWFYFLLPPVTMSSGFTLEAFDDEGALLYKHDGPAVTIERSKIRKANNSAYAKIGAIHAAFTIDASGGMVYFSKGNLQYTKSTNVWSFMENQFDVVETDGMNVGDDYTSQDIVSLFCWGTSGYHDSGDVGNTFYHPYSTHKDAISNVNNWYGYGPSTNMPSPNLVGSSANYDWGVNNAISNGGNASGQWRTLTIEEWDYVLNTRTASTVNETVNARYVKATVNDVTGVILFPDSYTHPATVTAPTNIGDPSAVFSVNNYTIADWSAMEAVGAVFLPAAGFRQGTPVGASVGTQGYYWSTTCHDRSLSRMLFFEGSQVLVATPSARCNGFSVRLVYKLP